MPPVEAVIEQLGRNIREEVGRWLVEGFEQVRKRYQAESFLLGQPITICERHAGAEAIHGIYRGIADDGALLLETAAGLSRHYAADVFPGLSDLS